MRSFTAAAAVLLCVVLTTGMKVTLRSQYMSKVGRQEWITLNSVADWRENETAFVVVDMWDRHWCETATTRVAELAVPMNETLTAVSIERKPATVLQRR